MALGWGADFDRRLERIRLGIDDRDRAVVGVHNVEIGVMGGASERDGPLPHGDLGAHGTTGHRTTTKTLFAAASATNAVAQSRLTASALGLAIATLALATISLENVFNNLQGRARC
jgi:hypothetical protein